MANEPQLNTDTLALIVAQSSDLQPRIWNQQVQSIAATEDVFSRMTGKPGSGMPIIEDRSLESTVGSEVIMSVKAPLAGRGVLGAGYRPGNEELLRANTFSCKIDYWWNGVALDKQTRNNTYIFSNKDNEIRKDLAEWFGRKQMNDLKMKLILSADPGRNTSAPGSNILRPNYKGSRDALKSADVITVSFINNASAMATDNGAKAPIIVKNKASRIDNQLRRYVFFSTKTGLLSLKADPTYENRLQNAGERGDMNPLFAAGFAMVDGNAVFEHEIVSQPSGPSGSPENPMAHLGTVIASGTTAVTVYGGRDATGAANTAMPYFDWWSNYPYQFTSYDAGIVDTTVRYAMGYNKTGANAGKFFMFSYQTNNGNSLTMVNRLGASATGAALTTLGSVAYGSGPYSGLLADALVAGSPIFEVNAYGVPIGYSYLLGEAAGVRCYGRDWMNRVTETRNYEFVNGIGIESEYGQAASRRADGILPNYVLCEHAIAPAGIPFPTVS